MTGRVVFRGPFELADGIGIVGATLLLVERSQRKVRQCCGGALLVRGQDQRSRSSRRTRGAACADQYERAKEYDASPHSGMP